MRLWVLASVALVACSDPAEWRPAKSAKDYPATKDAFRVQHAPAECESIGVVHAEGAGSIDDIAKTAAKHGGTHYVVGLDVDHPEQVTTTTGSTYGGAFVANSRSETEHHRTVRAEVYRCP